MLKSKVTGYTMAKCKNCNIEILDETECCPLCQSILEQNDALENMYPDVLLGQRKLTFFSRIYLFCAILLQSALFTINWFDDSDIWWSVITGLALLYFYVVLHYAILGKSGYKSKVILLSLIAVLSAVAIDLATGYRGWSVDYVLPGGILIMDATILGLMIYNRRNWQSYIMWQICMVLTSLLPIGLYITGIERNEYLAFLPMAVSLSIFIGTMIIGDRRARTELKRRFHIN